MLPLFLSLDRVVRLHASLIETYGGSPGLRDAGLLNSAIAVSQASFGGEHLHRDLFEMAAASSPSTPVHSVHDVHSVHSRRQRPLLERGADSSRPGEEIAHESTRMNTNGTQSP